MTQLAPTPVERERQRLRASAPANVLRILAQLARLNFFLFYFGLLYLWQRLTNRRSPPQESLGALLPRFFVSLGPLYVKIGQILSTRSDLFPEAITNELRKLQDDGPIMSEGQLARALRTEFQRPTEVFASFETTPIASASIAQVHRAVLQSGERVAVKLVRPGINELMRSNILLVGAVVRLLAWLSPDARRMHLQRRFHQVARLLLDQVDMHIERANQEAIGANFSGHPYVRVPRVHGDHCTGRALVMELVEAIPGNEFARVGLDRATLARRLQDTVYTMIYHHGLCHGDPHPGNVFFSPSGDIILVDFGITVHVDEDEKWGFSSFYYSFSRKEWDLAVDRFTRWFVEDAPAEAAALAGYRADLEVVLRKHVGSEKHRWSTIAYFNDVNEVLRKYGARYTPNFTKIELVFLSSEGFVSQIDPDIDLWENARKFTDRYSPYMSDEIKARFDVFFGQQIPRSIALRKQVEETLVAPTHLDRFFVPSSYPMFVERASGARLYDVDGNEYLDLSCGYGPHFLGYAPQQVVEGVSQALARGSLNCIAHEPEIELAQLLVEAFPGAERVSFSNSGTEAVMQAVRLCRVYTRRSKVAKFEGHYHGFSDQGLVSSWFRCAGPRHAPTPVRACEGHDAKVVQNTIVLQYGLPEALAQLEQLAGEVACVICEPMPGTMCDYDAEFLAALRALCTRLDIPLVFDEIVTGFRVRYGGIQHRIGVDPDITCLGKIIGGGLPVGAILGKARYINMGKTSGDPFIDFESRAFIGGTMSGNSLSCSAGVATLRHLRAHPEIYERLERHTDHLCEGFRRITAAHEIPFHIAGVCSIFGMSFTHRQTEVFRDKLTGSNFKANLALSYYMRKHGVYVPELHTLMLNAAHTDADIDAVCDAFERSLVEMIDDGFFQL